MEGWPIFLYGCCVGAFVMDGLCGYVAKKRDKLADREVARWVMAAPLAITKYELFCGSGIVHTARATLKTPEGEFAITVEREADEPTRRGSEEV